jgi:hypothetical protein
MKTFVFVIASLMLSGCASEREFVSKCPLDGEGPTATSEQECLDVGGSWARRGLRGAFTCAVPTTDGGKACRDTKDCQSFCVAPDSAEVGARVEGRCSSTYERFGACAARVCRGRAEPALCVE